MYLLVSPNIFPFEEFQGGSRKNFVILGRNECVGRVSKLYKSTP